MDMYLTYLQTKPYIPIIIIIIINTLFLDSNTVNLKLIFPHLCFNISLVTVTSTRIQSEDVLHGAHVIDEM